MHRFSIIITTSEFWVNSKISILILKHSSKAGIWVKLTPGKSIRESIPCFTCHCFTRCCVLVLTSLTSAPLATAKHLKKQKLSVKGFECESCCNTLMALLDVMRSGMSAKQQPIG
jgi:hypothetical protein